MDPPAAPARRRNAAATKAEILAVARRRFGEEGYDGASVRDIAAGAGIDPALVIRYFGSKEKLFCEAIGPKFDLRAVIEGDRDGLAMRLARAMLNKPVSAVGGEPLLLLVRSAQSDLAAGMLRSFIADGIIAPLAAAIGGPDGEQRAALIASTLLGVFVGRFVLALPAMAGDPEALSQELAAALQAIIAGPPDSAGREGLA